MDQFIFVISLIAILLILTLSMVSYFHKDFAFFPPSDKKTWQYLVFWILFRIMFFGLLILSARTFSQDPFITSWVRYLVWLPICLFSFGFATYLSIRLGWKNSHGEKQGLMVSGWYQRSRNPIYVASILGMLGWGLFVNSSFVYTLLSLWCLMYLLAPFFEEPWLEAQYGEDYRRYKAKVPRFFNLGSQFTQNISPHVQAELLLATTSRERGDSDAEFKHLENAHILGQESTYWHVKVHVCMLACAVRQLKLKEFFGQLFRIAGAATATPIGLVPKGNTGGANVSPFKNMPVSAAHQEIISSAKTDNKGV
jgi:protein-S-isoprenylcysteine O-methyltransferase Ste14